ncbi:sigma-54 dependent transcriptional regulator [Hellea sp.]|jgi:two-component system nitrogen regulation response regulator NtrX|nr:sigma-54 dependent transcriptional regulator [Hellea sp.]MDA8888651.1 sigma-54 dependent transcriptional regulator [Hellea sp.]MDB4844353.1 sigma-54 dependent transcriptional regulator [Hellea sp.]MDC0422442.1 sigma-54 dependent transcriptional regulator [Hellea sp.]MDC0651311.1 sigma-54 dependent transcriptional regulator [Hellea sp.]MDC1062096.1 sigma-54 dependent transcriptional regulator [Hellea sp.]
MKYDILIVEDEDDIRAMIGGILEDDGYEVRLTATSAEAINSLKSRKPSLMILDVWLKGSAMDGIELLDSIKKSHPNMPVIIISGHGTVETAVSAIRKGAYDYIVKPFKADKLLVTCKRALENARLKSENEELKGKRSHDVALIGTSSHVIQLKQKIAKIASTNSRVLISGQSGSGKELIARLLHENSLRSKGPFKAVNAASIIPERVEEELFGVEDESGNLNKVGLLERAHNGTLYLDEVADMPIETQGKLLRLLVEQRFRRLGGKDDVQVDVRVITSSSRDLFKEVSLGRFREDLYHRLNVMPLEAPPLKERREDIPALVEHFIAQLSSSTGLPSRKIGEDAMAALQAHNWPGNVRQLRNNVERLLILATGDPSQAITLKTLPPEVSVVRATKGNNENEKLISLSLRDAREHFERDYLKAQIQRFGGNISRTANFVGMERSALHRKLKSLGLSSNDRNEAEANNVYGSD